jgi:hypothetical protein
MKALIKKSASRFGLTLLVLLMGFILESGCSSSKPEPDASDPLAGWHFSSLNNLNSNKTITDDYQDYVKKLPSEEMNSVGTIHYFEDGTGQHAVQIRIGMNGTWWYHVLIYDRDNHRIRTIKYSPGGYRS